MIRNQIYRMRGMIFLTCMLCACSAADKDQDTGQGEVMDLSLPNVVAFTVYTDDACTELPPQDSVVYLDTQISCNETPDSSISNLKCFADRITYTNHPNTSDCSADGIENELIVGVCQEFPGPVPTWKYIDPETYSCLTE